MPGLRVYQSLLKAEEREDVHLQAKEDDLEKQLANVRESRVNNRELIQALRNKIAKLMEEAGSESDAADSIEEAESRSESDAVDSTVEEEDADLRAINNLSDEQQAELGAYLEQKETTLPVFTENEDDGSDNEVRLTTAQKGKQPINTETILHAIKTNNGIRYVREYEEHTKECDNCHKTRKSHEFSEVAFPTHKGHCTDCCKQMGPTRKCKDCGYEKHEADFGKSGNNGRRTVCKSCFNRADKEKRKAKKENV